VDLAIREPVDAVVFAGDVVEKENAKFEAFGRLEREVRRLAEAEIEVYAVSGNHDVETLPKLADLIPGFHLLGRAGTWELATVRRNGRPVAHLLGWSFPEDRFSISPLEGRDLPELRADGLPRYGVLHADLDGHGSPYAPVRRSELEPIPVHGWFLGHEHKPSDLSGPRPIGYLGSLVGLNPKETGRHGPWLLEASDAGLKLRQIPLAPIRWARIEIDVGGWESEEDLLPASVRALESIHRGIAADAAPPLAVGCRLRLTGNTRLGPELRAAAASPEIRDLRREWDGTLYFVDRAEDGTRPRLDLPEIAKDGHPAGLLARRVLALEERGPEADELVRGARARMEQVAAERSWQTLEPRALDDEQVREMLIDAGNRAIEELLRQVEADGAREDAR
jgi:hypothetical protein